MKNERLEEVMLLIKKGHKDALGQLYDITYQDIYRYIYSITASKEHALDLTHDVFIQAYRNIQSYNGKGHAMAWLITIARNQTYMFLRKHSRTILVDYDIDHVDDKVEKMNNSLLVDMIMNELKDDEREVVVLHIVEDLTFLEISKILEKKLSTVLSIYHRSIKKLKQKYGGAQHEK